METAYEAELIIQAMLAYLFIYLISVRSIAIYLGLLGLVYAIL
jgi:hypothetical protein